MTIDAGRVEAHYTRADLAERIDAALRAAGKEGPLLTPDDLAPLDQFHTGQKGATMRLAALAGIAAADRILDVGCGIGGPARLLAWLHGCRVVGLDLTPEFIRVAPRLTERTGLGDRVSFRQGSALAMPFADGEFDVVWAQNSSMNITDRDRLYGEIRRVLRTGGRFALQDVLAGPGGAPYYPTPFAREK